jgi:elongation factor Ts
MITTEQIKELRDSTGISVMQCKKALEEAGGDMPKALVLLKKKGAQVAAKKSDRVLGAGSVASYIHSTGSVGAMIELVSETDFVSKNEEFKSIARDIAMHITASNPEYLKKDDVPATAIETAKEMFVKEVEGKPEAMREKILEGKLSSYFSDRILLNQPFIKNPEITIDELLQSAIQKFGEKIEISRFVRFEVKK